MWQVASLAYKDLHTFQSGRENLKLQVFESKYFKKRERSLFLTFQQRELCLLILNLYLPLQNPPLLL